MTESTPRTPRAHIVFVEPEIPPNTGTTARLCVATGAALHLVGKLGFSIDDKHLKRAGLDYWKDLEIYQHASWEAFRTALPDARLHIFSKHGTRSYTSIRFEAGDFLVFGSESRGLPQEVLQTHAQDVVRIPMWGPVRSLNLANAAAIALYEGLRQLGDLDSA